MNKKHYLFTLFMLATAMLVTSCQKEEGTVTLGAEIVTILLAGTTVIK